MAAYLGFSIIQAAEKQPLAATKTIPDPSRELRSLPVNVATKSSHFQQDISEEGIKNISNHQPVDDSVVNSTPPDFNSSVLAAIKKMPSGGGYATTAIAAANFSKAAAVTEKGDLKIQHNVAVPSYCSSATFLVLLTAINDLSKDGTINLNPESKRALTILRQPDGVGIWGRWNSNGPGTARLFHELGAGENFMSIEKAQPGDFLKIWWNNEIGAKERGHLVVFISQRESETGERFLRFWSSNIPEGYGEKEIPISKAKRMLFSRLTRPQNFSNAHRLPRKDDFLASMLTHSYTMQNVIDKTGAKP